VNRERGYSRLRSHESWPGGKSRVADYVWQRLGDVDNYVEPFAGSLAALLRRPAEHFDGSRVKRETVNDINHFLANVWRAITNDPWEVARYADSPVFEADLHARHRYLVLSETAEEFRKRIVADPDYYDVKFAGWWLWGQCCWIGSGWCGVGVSWKQTQDMDGGRGVLASPDSLPESRPQLTDAYDLGRGVNAVGSVGRLSTQIPELDHTRGVLTAGAWDGTCESKSEWLRSWMQRLADRLRNVRTCYGHWSRICDSDSTLTRLGVSGVFLDPPYPTVQDGGKKSRDGGLYHGDNDDALLKLRDEVLAWCRKWGQSPVVRIAVCGYEGDGYESLVDEGWDVFSWSASGGYGNQRKGGNGKAENASRERIWFNPSCIKPTCQPTLFDGIDMGS
jgi:DNA adenine methylase